MVATDIFAIWGMGILMVLMTVLVAAIIWLLVYAIKRYKE